MQNIEHPTITLSTAQKVWLFNHHPKIEHIINGIGGYRQICSNDTVSGSTIEIYYWHYTCLPEEFRQLGDRYPVVEPLHLHNLTEAHA